MSERQSSGFEIEERALAPQSPAVADELAVRPDDAMAWDDDDDRIRAVRGSDGASGGRITDASRELAVRDRLSVGDVQQRVPDAHVERRPLRPKGDLERLALSVEVLAELRLDRADMLACTRIAGRFSWSQSAAREEQLGNPVIAGARDERADRRVEHRFCALAARGPQELGAAFHRPSSAPVGSMMMLSQPKPGTSVTSLETFAPSARAFSVAASMSSTLTYASHTEGAPGTRCFIIPPPVPVSPTPTIVYGSAAPGIATSSSFQSKSAP